MRFPLVAAAIAAAAPLAPAVAQDMPHPAIPPSGAILEVVAEGRTTRVPDVATINAGVVTQGETADAALSQNAARMAKMLAALKRAGVADRDIRTATIALAPQYRYGENQPPVITGYQATNSVAVRFRDIARSGAILDALVREGANQISGPDLSLDNPDAAMDEARTDAIRRARARAVLYAGAAGLRVQRILWIGEAGGAPQPPQPMMFRAKAEAADTQIAAGEQAVTASVTVRFLLDQP